MFKMTKFISILLTPLALIVTASSLQGQAVTVQPSVSPSVVMVGQSAEYMLTFRNTTSIPNLMTPRVAGLDFSEHMNTSTYQQIINNRATLEVRASWTFRPRETGIFTIPGRIVEIRGEQVEIPSVRFEVVPMDEERKSRAHLVMDLGEGPFYVGQAIPARLGLYVRSDLSLSNVAFPERSGDAFIHSEFERNPTRGRTRINGIQYDGVVWDIIITPIRAGPAELRFSQNISIQSSVADSRSPSFFNLTRTLTDHMAVLTEPLSLEILPLPVEDRPASFHNAIGDLAFSARLSSRDLMVGEPLTLTLTLEGQGNFERIAAPPLPAWDNWRVYPPKVQFEPGDPQGYSGMKSFEYILIPQSKEITKIPELAYSVFDPVTRKYKTTVLEAELVSVRPSDKPPGQGPLFAGGSPEDTARSRIPESLLPIRPDPGHLRPNRAVGWRNPLFWASNSGFALALLALAVWQTRRKRLRDDRWLAQRQMGGRKIRKALQDANRAAAAGDTASFFSALRFVVQERISHLSPQPVEGKSLVTSDCLSLLQAAQAPESVYQDCARLLESADAHQFAGIPFSQEELTAKLKNLTGLLQDLNRLKP